MYFLNVLFTIYFYFLFLLSHCSHAKIMLSSQTYRIEIDLKLSETFEEIVRLEPKLSPQTKLLVEFVMDTIPAKKLKNYSINGIPDFVLWSAEENIDPIRTKGLSDKQDQEFRFNCSQFYPCFEAVKRDSPKKEIRWAIDKESFWSNYNRSFIKVPLPLNTVNGGERGDWYVKLRNYPRGRVWSRKMNPPLIKYNNSDNSKPYDLLPVLKGILYLRLVTNSTLSCPGYMPNMRKDTDIVCGNHGYCKEGNCVCDYGYGGRDCLQKFIELPSKENIKRFREGQKVSSKPIIIEPFEQRVFNVSSEKQVKVILEINDDQGTVCPKDLHTDKKKLKNPNATNILHNVRSKQILSQSENILVSISDARKPVFEQMQTSTQIEKCDNIVKFTGVVEKGQLIIIYANATGSRADPPRPLNVTLFTEICGKHGDPCPGGSAAGVTLQLVIVFVCLVTVAVTAIFMFAMFWLDRMHGFTRHIDRLSPNEVDRMYPSKSYPAQIADTSEEQRNTSTNDRDLENASTTQQEIECTICLCEFEDTDMVRKLNCDHFFHSSCLDPWLTENRASCPTCRADVRLADLSDKRRMRRMVTLCLHPIISVRRQWEERRSQNLQASDTQNQLPDVDVEGIHPNASPRQAQPTSFRSMFSMPGARSTRGDASSIEGGGPPDRISLPGPEEFLATSGNGSSSISFSTAPG